MPTGKQEKGVVIFSAPLKKSPLTKKKETDSPTATVTSTSSATTHPLEEKLASLNLRYKTNTHQQTVIPQEQFLQIVRTGKTEQIVAFIKQAGHALQKKDYDAAISIVSSPASVNIKARKYFQRIIARTDFNACMDAILNDSPSIESIIKLINEIILIEHRIELLLPLIKLYPTFPDDIASLITHILSLLQSVFINGLEEDLQNKINECVNIAFSQTLKQQQWKLVEIFILQVTHLLDPDEIERALTLLFIPEEERTCLLDRSSLETILNNLSQDKTGIHFDLMTRFLSIMKVLEINETLTAQKDKFNQLSALLTKEESTFEDIDLLIQPSVFQELDEPQKQQLCKKVTSLFNHAVTQLNRDNIKKFFEEPLKQFLTINNLEHAFNHAFNTRNLNFLETLLNGLDSLQEKHSRSLYRTYFLKAIYQPVEFFKCFIQKSTYLAEDDWVFGLMQSVHRNNATIVETLLNHQPNLTESNFLLVSDFLTENLIFAIQEPSGKCILISTLINHENEFIKLDGFKRALEAAKQSNCSRIAPFVPPLLMGKIHSLQAQKNTPSNATPMKSPSNGSPVTPAFKNSQRKVNSLETPRRSSVSSEVSPVIEELKQTRSQSLTDELKRRLFGK